MELNILGIILALTISHIIIVLILYQRIYGHILDIRLYLSGILAEVNDFKKHKSEVHQHFKSYQIVEPRKINYELGFGTGKCPRCGKKLYEDQLISKNDKPRTCPDCDLELE